MSITPQVIPHTEDQLAAHLRLQTTAADLNAATFWARRAKGEAIALALTRLAGMARRDHCLLAVGSEVAALGAVIVAAEGGAP